MGADKRTYKRAPALRAGGEAQRGKQVKGKESKIGKEDRNDFN